eukprot:752888-Hanusia_phi.AAC.6
MAANRRLPCATPVWDDGEMVEALKDLHADGYQVRPHQQPAPGKHEPREDPHELRSAYLQLPSVDIDISQDYETCLASLQTQAVRETRIQCNDFIARTRRGEKIPCTDWNETFRLIGIGPFSNSSTQAAETGLIETSTKFLKSEKFLLSCLQIDSGLEKATCCLESNLSNFDIEETFAIQIKSKEKSEPMHPLVPNDLNVCPITNDTRDMMPLDLVPSTFFKKDMFNRQVKLNEFIPKSNLLLNEIEWLTSRPFDKCTDNDTLLNSLVQKAIRGADQYEIITKCPSDFAHAGCPTELTAVFLQVDHPNDSCFVGIADHLHQWLVNCEIRKDYPLATGFFEMIHTCSIEIHGAIESILQADSDVKMTSCEVQHEVLSTPEIEDTEQIQECVNEHDSLFKSEMENEINLGEFNTSIEEDLDMFLAANGLQAGNAPSILQSSSKPLENGMSEIKVQIPSNTALALTNYILRSITIALLQKLAEINEVRQDFLSISCDFNYVLAMAEKTRSNIHKSKNSIEKCSAISTWSTLMLVYLLTKCQKFLVHYGSHVSALFIASALEDQNWKKVIDTVAPDLIKTEIVDRLNSMQEQKERHPKFEVARSLVADQNIQVADLTTLILVKSSILFSDISAALYGLPIILEFYCARDVKMRLKECKNSLESKMHKVCVFTQHAFLNLSQEYMPHFRLAILFEKPSSEANVLLSQDYCDHIVVLDTVDPYIEDKFLLSGAKSYDSQVQVITKAEHLWRDLTEDACGFILHRSETV